MSVAGYRAEVVQSLGNANFFAGTSAAPEFASAVRDSEGQWRVDPAATAIIGNGDSDYDAWPADSNLRATYDFSRQGAVVPYPVGYSRTWEYDDIQTGATTLAGEGQYRFSATTPVTWTSITGSTSLELYTTDSNGLVRTSAEFTTIAMGTYLRYVSPDGSQALFRTTASISAPTASVATIPITLVRADTPGQTVPSGTAQAQFQWVDDAEFSQYGAAETTTTLNGPGDFAFATSGGSIILNYAGITVNADISLRIRSTDSGNVSRAATISDLVAGDFVVLIHSTTRWFAFQVVTGSTTGVNRNLAVRHVGNGGTGGSYSDTAAFIFLKGNVFNSENFGSFPYVEVNRLFGWLTVFGSTAETPLSLRGQYLPKKLLAGANSFTLSLSSEMLDDTDFGSKGWVSRIVGLHNAGLSISRYEQETEDFRKILLENQDDDVLVEITPVSDVNGAIGRGYFKIGTSDRSGDVNSLETTDLEYELNVFEDAETQRFVGFIWSDED